MAIRAKQIAQKLLQINAIKLSPQNPFTWASGIQSPIYCDNRLTLSYPEIRSYIIEGFIEMATAYPNVEQIIGVATAGIPHGALLADKMNLPFAYVRSKAKQHGRQNKIEGIINKGVKVLVVEDLISTGMSSLNAVESIREAGAEVLAVLSIFNYGFPNSKEAFEAKNCTFASLSDYSVLLEEAIALKYISKDERDVLLSWSKAPEIWGKNK